MTARRPRHLHLLLLAAGLLVAGLLVALCTHVRIRTALDDPLFDRSAATGMLRADPALLYYLLQRVLDGSGLPPDDWRADPRIEHPDLFDVPANLTVGQELAVAWPRLWLGSDEPLHVFCVRVMAILASLVLLGTFGLALELTGRVRWAVFAAALGCATLANYRTIGFVLMREDLSLPLWALHLWLLARAARTARVRDAVLAALAAVLALATWHAMRFVALAEVLVLLAVLARTGRNVVAGRAGLAALAVLAAGSLLVPVLRAKLFVLSPPMALLVAMHVSARVAARAQRPHRAVLATALGGGAALAAAGAAISAALGVHGDPHVLALMWSKIVRLGAPPADPGELSFAARMMWQGPFESLPPLALQVQLGVVLWLVVVAAVVGALAWWRRGQDQRFVAAAAFAGGTTLLALLVQRFVVLPAIVAPAVGVALLARARAWPAALARARLPLPSPGALLAALALALQIGLWIDGMRHYRLTWYGPPEERAEQAAMLRAIAEHVPPGAAVAGDPINSAAVLAFTGRGIVLQPKWEAGASLERTERLLTEFTRGTPAGLHRLLSEEYRCHWLLVDRAAMWGLARETCGFPPSQVLPPRGTPAAAFCSDDPYTLISEPRFELVWRSPRSIRAADGLPSDLYRLYRLR